MSIVKIKMPQGEKQETYLIVACYVNEVIDSEDDLPPLIESGWFAVKKEWLQDKTAKAHWHSLTQFYAHYTYDDVVGWFKEALKDGALGGFGAGIHKSS